MLSVFPFKYAPNLRLFCCNWVLKMVFDRNKKTYNHLIFMILSSFDIALSSPEGKFFERLMEFLEVIEQIEIVG